ncbi:MAG: cytidine deaminase [Caulobacter sp.]|nr:cytidine deaminase [Caulobacter sp.]
MSEIHADLIAAAAAVREQAFVPYSRFKVGSAVRGASGRIHTGCNVESASFGLTCCAERVAVFKAVSEGEREIVAVAVVTDVSPPAAPCGACRQVLYEFGADMAVIRANLSGERIDAVMRDLLPDGFDGKSLDF